MSHTPTKIKASLLKINFINPNSHAPFMFLDYLLEKGGTKNGGPPGSSRTTMHCPHMARHNDVAARLPRQWFHAHTIPISMM